MLCLLCFCFVHPSLTSILSHFFTTFYHTTLTHMLSSGKEEIADQTKHLSDISAKHTEDIKNHTTKEVSKDGGKTRDAIQVLRSAQQDSARKIQDVHNILMGGDVIITSSRKRNHVPNTVECGATTTTAESTTSMIDSESSYKSDLVGVSRNLYGSNNERIRTPATQKRKKKMGIMSSQKKRKAVSLSQRQEEAILEHNRRMNHPLRSEINFD